MAARQISITPRLLDVEQAAAYLGVSASKLRQSPDVPCFRWGRSVRYDRAALDRWLDKVGGLDTAAPMTVNDLDEELESWKKAAGDDAG